MTGGRLGNILNGARDCVGHYVEQLMLDLRKILLRFPMKCKDV